MYLIPIIVAVVIALIVQQLLQMFYPIYDGVIRNEATAVVTLGCLALGWLVWGWVKSRPDKAAAIRDAWMHQQPPGKEQAASGEAWPQLRGESGSSLAVQPAADETATEPAGPSAKE